MANFLEKVTQKLKGDGAEAKALKISRKAEAAIKGQIATLNARQVDDEATLDNAKEALDSAIFTGSEITSNQGYCSNIASAELSVRSAEENLKNTKDSVAFFTNLLTNFTA